MARELYSAYIRMLEQEFVPAMGCTESIAVVYADATAPRQAVPQRSPRSPVAEPGIFVAVGAASSSADRGHSLGSLHLPLAALHSFPRFSLA